MVFFYTSRKNFSTDMEKINFINKNMWRVNRLAVFPTFQTGEGCCLLPRSLVGKGKIRQAETGAVVLV